MLVAQLILCNQRDEQETHDDCQDETPHQCVPEIAAGDSHLDNVARTKPRQHDNNAGTKRPEIFQESLGGSGWLAGWRSVGYVHRYRLRMISHRNATERAMCFIYLAITPLRPAYCTRRLNSSNDASRENNVFRA